MGLKFFKGIKTVEKHYIFMKLAKTVITTQARQPDLGVPGRLSPMYNEKLV